MKNFKKSLREIPPAPFIKGGLGRFHKYQSLGNDFVLLDCLESPLYQSGAGGIKEICNRHYGVGADGVLIIQKNAAGQLESLIFNADGSNGDKCLNGLRCVAHYLVTQKNYPRELEIFMGDSIMQCKVADQITINVGKVDYQRQQQIILGNKEFIGHIINVGNPHVVILQQVTLAWLKQHGPTIGNYNIEFIWPDEKGGYEILVHERGCGITLACGTGAAAVMQTLYQLGKIKLEQEINLNMLGGTLISYIDKNNNIIQIAPAHLVFKGEICLE